MVLAAGGRPLLEMGGRRTHEQAAVAAARAAYVAGFAMTSNLEAGRRHGVPTAGTSAHAFTLAHPSELEAFRSQVATLGRGHDAARRHLRHRAGHPQRRGGRRHRRSAPSASTAVTRTVEVPRARALLDELGATAHAHRRHRRPRRALDRRAGPERRSTPTASARRSSPVPAPRQRVSSTSSSRSRRRTARTHRCVPVAKRSAGKTTVGGRKWAYRTDDGREVLRSAPGGRRPAAAGSRCRPPTTSTRARAHCAAGLRRPARRSARRLDPGPPAWTAEQEDVMTYLHRPHRTRRRRRAERLRRSRRAVSASAAGLDVVRRRQRRGRARRRAAGALRSSTRRTGTRPTRRTSPRTAARGRCTASRTPGARSCTPTLAVAGEVVRKGEHGEDGYSGFSMRDPVSGDVVPDPAGRRCCATPASSGSSSSAWPPTTACARPRSRAASTGWPVTVPVGGRRGRRRLDPGDGERTRRGAARRGRRRSSDARAAATTRRPGSRRTTRRRSRPSRSPSTWCC